MRGRWALAALAATLGGFVTLVPVRHHATLEADPDNAVQRIRVESRSLAGLRRPGWGLTLAGVPSWQDGSGGFFLEPASPGQASLSAWPGYARSFRLIPSAGGRPGALQEEGDREAFRTWFVAILEQQLEAASPAWEPAQRDCAGLLRFAFRESLVPHTAAWRERVAFTAGPPGQDPAPGFAGAWREGFPTPEGRRPFARGAFLRRFSCLSLGQSLELARPGDLIFFARGGARAQPDHVMAFVRPDVDGAPMLLYHTGPDGSAGTDPGEVRRVRLDDLMHHPEPDFRPLPENPSFLGLYRWHLLAEGTSEPSTPRS